MNDPAVSLFSKIARGEIPCSRVFETDRALAFLDINPVNHGHLLLIPKEQFATVGDLPDDLAAHLGSLLPRLCRAVKSATGADALNVIANNGAVAGQTISHVHWHVIPRFTGDAVHWPWPHSPYAEGGLQAMQRSMAEALGGS